MLILNKVTNKIVDPKQSVKTFFFKFKPFKSHDTNASKIRLYKIRLFHCNKITFKENVYSSTNYLILIMSNKINGR